MTMRGLDAEAGLNDRATVDKDDESDHDGTILPDEIDEDELASHTALLTDVDLLWPVPQTPSGSRELLSYRSSSLTLSPGITVELNDGDFLMITTITQREETRQVFLEGQIFRRARCLNGLLEKKKNEIVWIQRYNPNIDGDTFRQSLQRVSTTKVIQIRDLILTNQLYPHGSYRSEPVHVRQPSSEILETYRLTCRWKYLSSGDKEGCLTALKADETDAWYRSPCVLLKSTYRGISTGGGSCPDWLAGERNFDISERTRCNNLDPFGLRQPTDYLEGPGKRYTFGDGFCGAGGVSRGAKAAGLRVLWGFDFNRAAIESYRANFHETMCWCCPAHTFVTAIPDDVKVDILHISPPCQTFSPAHVHPGQNDDANEASFFALEEILKKVKPRVVMVEETFGLLRTGYRMQWFRAMIQIFTRLGFSVRWKIFKLLDFGLPGRRERLFIFASCPGEPLPDFPRPSHCNPTELGTKSYLSPYRTINDAIGSIPTEISAHADSKVCNEPAYHGGVPLPNTICCGNNAGKHPSSRGIHPSGKRTFTSRELACLNGFPLEHEFGKFGKTELRKQIGNAVPPVVAKVFLEQIVKSLRRTDGL